MILQQRNLFNACSGNCCVLIRTVSLVSILYNFLSHLIEFTAADSGRLDVLFER